MIKMNSKKELESFELELSLGEEITKEKLEQVYKVLTGRSIPEVTAFIIENIEFEKITWKIKFT